MPGWLEITLTVFIGLSMLVGLIGLLVPIFPGLVILWLAALGYGIVAGFNTPGIILFTLITLLAIGGSLVDNVLMAAGGRKGGASWVTIVIALLAGIAGTILLPPFGGIIAAPLAIFLLEYLRLKDLKKAWQAFKGLTIGWGLSFAARFGLGLVIVLLWVLWVWKG
jgi:uncharacterized protein